MLSQIAEQTTVYLITGYSDLRKGIDGLASIISGSLQLNPFDKSLYLFCGKCSSKIKGLMWDGDGFVLLYKRLDGKGRFHWPRNETEAKCLTNQQIRWLFEGLEIEQKNAIKPSQPYAIY